MTSNVLLCCLSLACLATTTANWFSANTNREVTARTATSGMIMGTTGSSQPTITETRETVRSAMSSGMSGMSSGMSSPSMDESDSETVEEEVIVLGSGITASLDGSRASHDFPKTTNNIGITLFSCFQLPQPQTTLTSLLTTQSDNGLCEIDWFVDHNDNKIGFSYNGISSGPILSPTIASIDNEQQHHVTVVAGWVSDICNCHPTGITFRFLQSDCYATHDQAGKFTCKTGSRASGSSYISTTAKTTTPTSNQPINNGDLIKISTDSNKVLDANTRFQISGTFAQEINIHTSCSRLLRRGDVFGSLSVVDWECSDSSRTAAAAADDPDALGRLSVQFYVDGFAAGDSMSVDHVTSPQSCHTTTLCVGSPPATCNHVTAANYPFTPDEVEEAATIGDCGGEAAVECSHVTTPTDTSSGSFDAESPICRAADGELTLVACVTQNTPSQESELLRNDDLTTAYCLQWLLLQPTATTYAHSLKFNLQTDNPQTALSDSLAGSVVGEATHLSVVIQPHLASCNCHPSAITFYLSGGACAHSTHSQQSKFQCTEASVGGSGTVYVVNGQPLSLGSQFVLTATGDRLSSQSEIEIEGKLNQRLSIHTSCSQPLAVGDIFGALTVASFECSESVGGPGGMSSASTDGEDDERVSVTFYENGIPVGRAVAETSEIESCTLGSTTLGRTFDGTIHSMKSFSRALNVFEIREEIELSTDCQAAPLPSVSPAPPPPLETGSSMGMSTESSMGTTNTDDADDDDDVDLYQGCNFPWLEPGFSNIGESPSYLVRDCISNDEITTTMRYVGPSLSVGFCYDGPAGDQGYPFSNVNSLTTDNCLTLFVDGQSHRLVLLYGINQISTPTGLFQGNFLDNDPNTNHHVTITIGFTPDTPPQPLCNCHPYFVEFKLMNGDCSTFTHDQDGKFKCKQHAVGDGSGLVTVTVDKGDVLEAGALLSVGDRLTITGGTADKISADSKIFLRGGMDFDLEIHTSCSRRLDIGDRFGPLVVERYGGGGCDNNADSVTMGMSKMGMSTTTTTTTATATTTTTEIEFPADEDTDDMSPGGDSGCSGTVNAKFYVDGHVIYEVDVPSSPPVVSCGGELAYVGGVEGRLSHVAVWDGQLSDQQVLDVATTTTCSCAPPGPIVSYCVNTTNKKGTTSPKNPPTIIIISDSPIERPTAICVCFDFTSLLTTTDNKTWIAVGDFPDSDIWVDGTQITCSVTVVDSRGFSVPALPESDGCDSLFVDASTTPTCNISLGAAVSGACVGEFENFSVGIFVPEEATITSLFCDGVLIDIPVADRTPPTVIEIENTVGIGGTMECSVSVVDSVSNRGVTTCSLPACS